MAVTSSLESKFYDIVRPEVRTGEKENLTHTGIQKDDLFAVLLASDFVDNLMQSALTWEIDIKEPEGFADPLQHLYEILKDQWGKQVDKDAIIAALKKDVEKYWHCSRVLSHSISVVRDSAERIKLYNWVNPLSANSSDN